MDASTPESGSGHLPMVGSQAPVPAITASVQMRAPALPAWDTEAAVAFLIALIGSGLLAVAAIDPELGGCHGATFALPTERDALSRWIEARQGKHNLYFTLNEPVPREQQQGKHGRVCKADIARIRGIAIDCDPHFDPTADDGGLSKERERLWHQALDWRQRQEASAVIDSGGGYQGVWLLRESLPATPQTIAAAEAQARGFALLNGGDNTHDVSHLFRMPGTVNLPNAKKRARKRVPAPVLGKVYDPRRLHTLDHLAILAPPITARAATARAATARAATAAKLNFDLSAAWEAVGAPERLDPELVERLTRARAARPQLDKCLAAEAMPGDRSARDYAVAAAVIQAGISEPADVAAIIAAYSPDKFEAEAEARDDGRAEYYLRKTVANALARVKPDTQPGDFFKPIQDGGEDGVQAAGRREGEKAASEIGELVDIFGDDDPADLSTSPAGSLPGVIEGIARTIATQMGVPESFVATAAVAALAGTIGNALKLQVNAHSADFSVPATLSVVIVARPGRKKSPTIAAVLRPVKQIDRELYRQSCQEQAAREAMVRAAKSKREAAGGLPPAPPMRRLWVDDATLEKQVRIHADNPCGIIRAPDELFAFLGSFGAYKRNGDGDRSTMLRLIDGGDISVDRMTGSTRADSALMGLIASTQPDKIRQHAQNLGTDGFLQRLIFVTDDGAERTPLDVPADGAAVAEYERAVRGMFALRAAAGRTVQLSPEARTILTGTWTRVRALGRLPGASAAWEGHISKWEGLIYRIALTFHALDTWDLTGGVSTESGHEVTAETAQRASRFVAFLVRHALRFYSEFCEPAEETVEAREVAGYLLTRPDILSVTARDIEKARRPLSGKRHLTRSAMRALADAGWVSVAEMGADGPTKWTIDPRIHVRFAERADREKARRTQAHTQMLAALSAKRELRDV
ncbi:hypothetical protein ASG32_23295 [Methylobacterium sp. Leaf361]|uniref:DUF3987 domain-containing protein n=1 Tax=Methylobacterium sp. Leaf361 TaxID=1736352 RepID=UPI0006FA9196|nr:DUF3987 domain-containing protein [Methylobacterium sp. Leaf361]KQS82491.1 hypothetical protein ASG32_23295 [Methylobacterium sp. Leaf361]